MIALKKSYLLYAVLLVHSALAAFSMRAEVVDRNDAMKTARMFFEKNSTKAAPVGGMELVGTGRDGGNYYIFNCSGGGFVIIAGNDCVSPVLAYSLQGRFCTEGMPANLRSWLDLMDEQMDRAVAFGGNGPAVGDWEMTKAAGTPVVLLETPLWEQTDPFNRQCPVFQTGMSSQRAVVGCVATVGSMVCWYFKWPEHGQGTISYSYVSQESGKTIAMPARNLASSTYSYKDMPSSFGASFTKTQADAVSTLALDLGYATRMQYGVTGSATSADWLTKAMVDNMGYDKGAYTCYPYARSEEEWFSLIKEHLQKGPVPYAAATSKDEGHAFLLDGYTTDDMFHVNWGWKGACNGYFKLNSLKVRTYDFTKQHSAILGLVPDMTGDSKYRDSFAFMYLGEGDPTFAKYRGLTTDGGKIVRGEKFYVNCGAIANISTHEFNGVYYIALCDKDGNVKEEVSERVEVEKRKPITELQTVFFEKIPCTITETIRGGDRLKMFYSGQYSSGVFACFDAVCRNELIVAESDMFTAREIAEVTTVNYSCATKKLDVKCKYGVECRLTDSNGTVVEEYGTEDGGVWSIGFSDLPSGRYTVSLQDGPEPYVFDVVI